MGDGFHMGAESRQWINMQIVAPLYPKCAISQTTKNQKSISNELQYKAKQDVISISKNISTDTHVVYVSLRQRNSNTQAKFGFFWPLNNPFGFSASF